MEFSKRKVLLVNEDVPNPIARPPLPDAKHAVNTSAAPPQQQFSTPASPLQVAIRPVFASSVAYVFLILFTTFFFIGFVFLYFRQFPSEVATFRRSRSRRSPPSAAAKSLPVVAHRGNGGKQAECAICLEEFGDGEAVKVIPQCGHVFHPQCIDTWLEAHVSCPMCRCSEFSGAAVKESEEVESV